MPVTPRTQPPEQAGGAWRLSVAPRQGLRVGVSVGSREPVGEPIPGKAAPGSPAMPAELAGAPGILRRQLPSSALQQRALFLCMALERAPNVQSACLVDTGGGAAALPWPAAWQPAFGFDDVCDRLDVLIELGGPISAAQTECLKRRGTRIVCCCSTPDYVAAAQAMLFQRPLWGSELFVNQRYDALWMVPQVAELNRGFVEVLCQRQAEVVPLVWDPVLLQQRCAGLHGGGTYRPRVGAARVSVMEPNVDVLANCLYPVLIAEQAYRCSPDLIGLLQVTDAQQLSRGSDEFASLMGQLDLVRDQRTRLVGHFDTALFLAEMTDAVISHRWSSPLDEFHFEVCWQGYPLVHNAELCRDLGYYYPGHDLQQAARVLREALATHDGRWLAYRERQRELIGRHLPDHPALVERYAQLLDDLMQRPLH